jgi:hypothetical protein
MAWIGTPRACEIRPSIRGLADRRSASMLQSVPGVIPIRRASAEPDSFLSWRNSLMAQPFCRTRELLPSPFFALFRASMGYRLEVIPSENKRTL